MKTNKWKVLYAFKLGLLMLSLFITNKVEAQSLFWRDGQKCAEKISETEYAPVPSGVVTYKLENGEYWQLYSGEPIVSEPYAYIKKSENRIRYYNRDKNLIGYYIPSQNRYYRTSAIGENILKEVEYAVISERLVYRAGEEDDGYSFRIEDEFSREWLGFFLFFVFS